MNTPAIIAVIPARYASSRLPGKPLREIAGKPLIQRVVEQLYLVESLDRIIVATDDHRIADFCDRLEDVDAMMTSHDHRSGTDRCAEASEEEQSDAIVLNVQGDEPFISPDALEELIEFYRASPWDVGTMAVPINASDAQDQHIVKAVFTERGRALYFSRSPIPFHRDEGDRSYHKHLGIYIFRNEILQNLSKLPSSKLEMAERLEQLRWMEQDYSVGIHITDRDSLGIDTEEDIRLAEQLIEQAGSG